MNRYLLDTNTCIEYLRGKNHRLVARIRAKRPRELRLCSVVLAELFHGAYRSADSQANILLVTKFVDTLLSFAFDDRAADVFGLIRAGLIVVSHNVGEFARVPGLIVEDWTL